MAYVCGGRGSRTTNNLRGSLKEGPTGNHWFPVKAVRVSLLSTTRLECFPESANTGRV
jgi:hypothetical protein